MSRVNAIRNIVTSSIFEPHIYSSVRSKEAVRNSLIIGSVLIGQRQCVSTTTSTFIRTTTGIVGQTGRHPKYAHMLDKYNLCLNHTNSLKHFNILKGTLCIRSCLLVPEKSSLSLRLERHAFHSRCHPGVLFAKDPEDTSSKADDTTPDEHKAKINKETEDLFNGEKQPIGQVKSTHMRIVYTCKVCGAQNTNTFAKSSYTHGVVIVTCQGCTNNHLIADNLGWFQDVGKRNIEEILSSKGEKVKKILTKDGTLEVHDGREKT